jgi:sugar phosphate permease
VLSEGERRSQRVAWSLTWFAYATYYLGRKGFGVVKEPIQRELGLGLGTLGLIDSAFQLSYMVGQFVSGHLGDRYGARRLVGFGMLASAFACAAFGSASGAALMLALFFVNGLAQSTGWPGTTRAMAEWTVPARRGTVMAYWSTCYQVGGIAATWLAGEVAERYGWRAAFYVAALGLFGVGLLVLGCLPARRGLSAPASDARVPDVETPLEDEQATRERRAAQRAVLRSARLWLYGASYFFIKMIRYALASWLPYYLSQRFAFSTSEAARFSVAGEVGGILGVIVLGHLSDRLPWRGRASWALLWLLGLGLASGLYVAVGERGALENLLLLGLIGALLFGPDALLSGAAAQDAGGPLAAGTATGFVNGLGSLGALLQGLFVPVLVEHFGWRALFPAVAVCSLLSAVVLVPVVLRERDAH